MITDVDIMADLEQGKAPFTMVYIDEAGLISRTTCAALSLLASRRVVLVGDSKQLSPICRISRILPPDKKKWTASSGLTHLDSINQSTGELLPANVLFLKSQHRMHPEIGDDVSQYMYDNQLEHADENDKRKFALRSELFDPSRAITWRRNSNCPLKVWKRIISVMISVLKKL